VTLDQNVRAVLGQNEIQRPGFCPGRLNVRIPKDLTDPIAGQRSAEFLWTIVEFVNVDGKGAVAHASTVVDFGGNVPSRKLILRG
jgi:hypothetical protein